MTLKKLYFSIFLSLTSPLILFSSAKKNTSTSRPEITEGRIIYTNATEINLKSSIYRDYTGDTKCEDLKDTDFTHNEFPFKPGFFEGILWFNIEITKPENFDNQRYILMLGENHIDFAEAFVKKNGTWTLFGRAGRGISKTEMSITTSDPMIPLMENLFEGGDVTHLRVRLNSNNGSPINFNIVSNTKLYFSTRETLSRFCLSGGMGICIFFILLLIGLLLKDSAYLFLALSALMYYLRAMQLRGIGPAFFLLHIAHFHGRQT